MSAHDVFFVQSPVPDRVDKKVRNALVHDSSAVGLPITSALCDLLMAGRGAAS